MKITRIYLKNLNSLYGDFTIDLEKEPFASSGIFAITGPTGAGKSTILDAITLALYGRAARYDSKPNPENMMSRGTGECHAEVEFEVEKGRYKASWQMQRARKKPDEKVQPAKRYVYDSQGIALAQKGNEVDKVIEELTGLDVDRFFRSVLLAQGDFVKFLKASPDDRALLLESLTATEIYTTLSMRAHEETVERATAFKIREKELEVIKLLGEDDLAALIKHIDNLKTEIEIKSQSQIQCNHLIVQGDNLVKYRKNREELRIQQEINLKKSSEFEADFKRLKIFRQGAVYYPGLQTLDQHHKANQDKKSDLIQAEVFNNKIKEEFRAGFDATSERLFNQIERCKKALFDSAANRDIKFKEIESLEKWLEKHKHDQTLDNHLSHIIEEIMTLTHHRNKLNDLQKSQLTHLQEIERGKKNLDTLQKKQADVLNKFNQIKSETAVCEKEYLEILAGKTEDRVVNEISKDEKRLHFLEKKQSLWERWKKTTLDAKEIREHIQDLKIKYDLTQKQILEDEEFLRLEKEKIKVITQKRDHNRLIASLHEHRENLEIGKPCPLCGSIEHPLRDMSTSLPKVSELDKELQNLEGIFNTNDSRYKKLLLANVKTEESLKYKQEDLEKYLKQIDSIKFALKNLIEEFVKSKDSGSVETVISLREDFEESSTSLTQQNQIISINQQIIANRSILKNGKETNLKINESHKSLVNAGHEREILNDKITSLLGAIQTLTDQYEVISFDLQQTQSQVVNIEDSVVHLLTPYAVTLPASGEEKSTLESLKRRKLAFQEKHNQLMTLKADIQNLGTHHRDLEQEIKILEIKKVNLNAFSDSNQIQKIESNSQMKIMFSAQWNTLSDAEEGLRRVETSLNKSQMSVDERTNESNKANETHAQAEIKLSSELQDTAFQTINGLRASQLTFNDEQHIQKIDEELKERSAKLQGQISHIEAELETLKKNNPPHGDQLEEIRIKFRELNAQRNDLYGQLAVAEANLKRDMSNRIQHADLLEELDSERTKLSIWQKLSDLIGSHDGKVFRKFAQGLSLDLLIKHANKHLSVLSNRYQLKRIIGEQLDLEIEDQYQANTTRPTASLSGGESFLTSLALALGLSDLAGKNVRIDSLFIDEGFGTLDPDSLEVAVQALENLRSKNKTIGVISHIELLKERITTQIVIEKGSGGKSSMRFSE